MGGFCVVFLVILGGKCNRGSLGLSGVMGQPVLKKVDFT